MMNLRPPAGWGNRIKVVTDGHPISKNTHVLLVDQEGEILGEIPCTRVRVDIIAGDVARIAIEAIGMADLDLPAPPKDEEFMSRLLVCAEYTDKDVL
jgi:hypothetical protein